VLFSLAFIVLIVGIVDFPRVVVEVRVDVMQGIPRGKFPIIVFL